MGKTIHIVMQSIHRQQDADHFQEVLNGCLEEGGEIISSGMQMHGVTPAAWAFVQLPEGPGEDSKEQPAASDAGAWDWLEQKVLKRYREESRNDFGLSEVEHAWQMALDYVQEARRRAKAGI